MTVRSPYLPTNGPVPVEQVRSILIGPAVAKALHENRLPYYSQPIGSPLGLDPTDLYCSLCGGGFIAPSFGIASTKGHLLFNDDQRIGSRLLVMHRPCVRMAEDYGQTLDEFMVEMQASHDAVIAQRPHRGDA